MVGNYIFTKIYMNVIRSYLRSNANFYLKTPNSWEFFVQILHTYYAFLSTIDYKFLFNYLQL